MQPARPAPLRREHGAADRMQPARPAPLRREHGAAEMLHRIAALLYIVYGKRKTQDIVLLFFYGILAD